MRALACFAPGDGGGARALIEALRPREVCVLPVRPEQGEKALSGLCPLGFAGAWVGDGDWALALAQSLSRLEPEAREAGRVDALFCEWAGLRGAYLAPGALEALLSEIGFAGLRALWVGPGTPGLAAGLRSVGRLDVLSPDLPAGEALARALPPAQRGRVVPGVPEARALARTVDVVIYAGGRLPLEILAPYHVLLALAPLANEASAYVERVVGPERFLGHRLAAFVREALGIDLSVEDFLSL